MKAPLVDEIADVVIEGIDVGDGQMVEPPTPNPMPGRRLLRWERGDHPQIELRVAESFVEALEALDEDRYFARLLDIKAWARRQSAARAPSPWLIDDAVVDLARRSS